MSDQAKRPNFLFIITDQQRADTLGAHGSTLGATPHLDRMASEGVTFERGYCNNPLCMPSRASIFTGRCPSSTGVRTNGCIAHEGLPILPMLLKEAGYHTGARGKIHYHPAGGETDQYWPENRLMAASGADVTRPYLGFDTIALGCGHGDVAPGLHSRWLEQEHPEVYARRGPKGALEAPDPWLLNADKISTYKTAIPEELYPTSWVVDNTVEMLGKIAEPFFAWCGINDPHHPFKPPGRYWDMFKPEDMPLPPRCDGELDTKPPHIRAFYEGDYEGSMSDGFMQGCKNVTDERLRLIMAAYYGMVAMIDDGVARMLDALRTRGIEQDTVVVFVSDHGELLGDHPPDPQGPDALRGAPARAVPVALAGPLPGRAPRGRPGRSDGPCSPRSSNWPGVTVPDGTQGRSLVEPLMGRSARAHEEVYIEDDVDLLGLRLRTLVTERWKCTTYAGEDYGEIYDLENDPNEFENLWDTAPAEVKRDLLGRLLDAVARHQDWLPAKTSHA